MQSCACASRTLETLEAFGQAPDTLTATTAPTSVTLSWSAVHAGEVLFYEVYRERIRIEDAGAKHRLRQGRFQRPFAPSPNRC